MKKILKGISFITKILLVVGLLMTDFSGLSLVFADQVELVAILNGDNQLEIEYTEVLDDVDVKLVVTESYTYTNESSIDDVVNSYELTDEEIVMLVSDCLSIETILSDTSMEDVVIFDGEYDAKVELYLDDELTDTVEVVKENTHETGLTTHVYDIDNNEEITGSDGVYYLDSDSTGVKIEARVLSGGLDPDSSYSITLDDGTVSMYTAIQLLECEFVSEKEFSGSLYGEYILPVNVELTENENNLIQYEDSVMIAYGDISDNGEALNTSASNTQLDSVYKFSNSSEDGVIYGYKTLEHEMSLYDLYQIIVDYNDSHAEITAVIGNALGDDVISLYDEDADGSIQEYLENISVDDGTYVSLYDENTTIKFSVTIVGDVNNDGEITDDDLLSLVDQVIGKEEETDDGNVYKEESDSVNVLDVLYLNQVINTGRYDVSIETSSLELVGTLESVSEVTSGEEFTVTYVVPVTDMGISGLSGEFTYSEDILELVSITGMDGLTGDNYNGKFIYIGNDSLVGEEVVTTLEDGDEKITYNAVDYVLVTAVFKAKFSGDATIGLSNLEYFNQSTYYENTALIDDVMITVIASDVNRLGSLTINGDDITIEEDVYEYSYTVGYDVTTVNVDAIPGDLNAVLTSVSYPDELVVGENTVVITVTSESGKEQVYTITVVREDAPVTENNVVSVSYTDTTTYEDDADDVTTDTTVDDVDDDVTGEIISEEESGVSKVIIIILILLVIVGLIYLIFKDDDDDEEKKTNKEINKLKNTNEFETAKKVKKNSSNKKRQS